MFMRFIHLRIQPDKLADFEQFYEQRIATAIGEAGGCLFAGLLSNPEHPSECVSLTLWNDPESAANYESSGLYDRLLEEIDPFLWRSNEWRVRLSDDLTLEYEPVHEAPVIEAFPVETESGDAVDIGPTSPNMYLRIVSGKVKPGKMEAFTEYYENSIIPLLLATDGCRYAYLARGTGDSNEALSVTLWDSQSKASAYEQYGGFRDIIKTIEPYISSVYQWRMTLDSSRKARETSSEDLQIEGYQIVAGESFTG
jgi:quinol monooxygenase YgiN